MRKKRIVVTGLGILCSNGIGKEEFSQAVLSGASGIKPISLFDTSSLKAKTAGEIKDFRPEDFLGTKGLRTLDRSSKLVASAAKLALDDARFEITGDNTNDIGVAIGSTLGSISSVSDFHRDAIKDGPRYVNPAFFPNTVINSPASQISIKFNIKGFNATIATGFTASLDAINYAVDFLRLGRVRMVLAGGVEELCPQTFLAFYKTGFLAGLNNGSPEISCPFDKRRNGIIFGEGAAVLVLEDLPSALNRRANIYAEVLGFGMGFEPYRICAYNLKGLGLRKAMRMALNEAGIHQEDIDCILAAANSTVAADLIETEAIKDVFGRSAQKINISSIKSMIGECYNASGALQVVAAAAAIEKGIIPPTINYLQKDTQCNLNYVANTAKECRVDKVLINAFGPSGCNSSLVISRFKE